MDVIDEKVMQGEQFFERHGKKIIIDDYARYIRSRSAQERIQGI